MSTSRNSTEPSPAQWRSIVRRSVVSLLVLVLLLFVPAGSINWARGWLFLWVLVTLLGVSARYLWRINPEIFAARSRIHPGTKRWDRILLGFLFPAMLAIVPVGALDDGRFHWSRMSWWWVGLGYLLLITGTAITAWAQAVNRFFEPGVRIQTERGHHVVDTGPYAIIRHPRLFRRVSPIPRHRFGAGFLVGADSCRLRHAINHDKNRVGRPHITREIGRIRSLRTTRTLSIDSRRMVALPSY
jgi:hypothetical protein